MSSGLVSFPNRSPRAASSGRKRKQLKPKQKPKPKPKQRRRMARRRRRRRRRQTLALGAPLLDPAAALPPMPAAPQRGPSCNACGWQRAKETETGKSQGCTQRVHTHAQPSTAKLLRAMQSGTLKKLKEDQSGFNRGVQMAEATLMLKPS